LIGKNNEKKAVILDFHQLPKGFYLKKISIFINSILKQGYAQ
jgi:hypothetical protein